MHSLSLFKFRLSLNSPSFLVVTKIGERSPPGLWTVSLITPFFLNVEGISLSIGVSLSFLYCAF